MEHTIKHGIHTLLVDDAEPCMHCGSRGGHYEDTERGTRMFVACRYCHGTGRKTVVMTQTFAHYGGAS